MLVCRVVANAVRSTLGTVAAPRPGNKPTTHGVHPHEGGSVWSPGKTDMSTITSNAVSLRRHAVVVPGNPPERPDWMRTDLDPEDAAEAQRAIRVTRSHAASLRRQAELLDPVTAEAFRRRAAELELAAWTVRARLGDRRPVDRDLPLPRRVGASRLAGGSDPTT